MFGKRFKVMFSGKNFVVVSCGFITLPFPIDLEKGIPRQEGRHNFSNFVDT